MNLLTCPFMELITPLQSSWSKNAWFPKVCCKIYIPVLWMWLVSKFWKRQTVNQFSLTHNLKEPCKKIRMLVFSSILQFHTIDNRYSWSAKIIPIVFYANPSLLRILQLLLQLVFPSFDTAPHQNAKVVRRQISHEVRLIFFSGNGVIL